MEKFEDYPVVMLDLYGRERHPESTNNEGFVVESYNDRAQRAQLMIYTLQYMQGGVLPANRYILIDEENVAEKRTGPYATFAIHMFGGRPQGATIIDLNGKVFVDQKWERPEQLDEALSAVFGLEPGL